jgi:multiple sugar transport system substrate-binding protein
VNDAEMRKVFGTELKGIEGKNISALFYNEYGPSRPPNVHNDDVASIPLKYFEKIVYENTDINTALRQAEEEMTKKVESVQKTN